MLRAEAHVETERASRYLAQLCRHFSRKAQAHPEAQTHVEWSDDVGTVRLHFAKCSLRADPGCVLTLRAEASDEENLQRIEGLVASHLKRSASTMISQWSGLDPRTKRTTVLHSDHAATTPEGDPVLSELAAAVLPQ